MARVQFIKRKETKAIVVHCAATKPTMDIGVREIRQWHVKQGWLDVGYHYVIRRDGTVETGRPHDVVGSHVSGRNSDTLGICLVGGIDANGRAENNFTDEQWQALAATIHMLKTQAYFECEVLGHRDLNPGKECPSFDARSWWLNQIA